MLIIVTVVLLAFIFTYRAITGSLKYTTSFDVFISVVVAFIIGLVVDFSTLGFIYSGDEYIKREAVTELVESRQIVALEDVNSDKGDFFLGCGSVGTESYYSFYYEGEQGTIADRVKLYDERCPVYINEISNKEVPRIEEYRITQKNTLMKKAGYISVIARIMLIKYDVGDELSSEWGTTSSSEQDAYYKIYVPKNTIKENYNIDLE